MKSVLMKVAISLIVFISCSNVNATITRYENTDTNSLVYGYYDFDDVLNTFSNITLKANFTKLSGPSEANLDTIQRPLQDSDAYNMSGSVITEGSRPDTYYRFSTGSILFKEIPQTLVVSTFERWEIIKDGAVIDYVSGFTAPDFMAEFVDFTAKPGNVSNVPEPEVISLLAICPMILLARRRKQQK